MSPFYPRQSRAARSDTETDSLLASLLTDEPAIDARHTIDSTRRWTVLSSASERHALDQELIKYPELWEGPFELTSKLLSSMVALRSSDDVQMQELVDVVQNLAESLEEAAVAVEKDSLQRLYILGLLGVFFEALTELTWQLMQLSTELVNWGGQLLVDLIWRDQEQIKIAIGVLERLGERDSAFASNLATNVAFSILARLRREIDDPFAALDVHGSDRLVSISTIFESCLTLMLASSHEDANNIIQDRFLKTLSPFLSLVLERTIEDPSDEHVAELDIVSTKLYDLCDKALRDQAF